MLSRDEWRTTIDVPDELLRRSEVRAADEGVPLSVVVEEALRLYLGKRGLESGYELQWRTEKGRLLDGVPLDDRSALLDFLDNRGV